MTGPANAGSVLSEFIESELDAERARRAGLDARGLGVVATSGTLVSLIFALGALVTGIEGFTPSAGTVWALVVALAAFIAAAIFGLWANRLVEYLVVTPDQFYEWRKSNATWNDTEDKARRVRALANTRTIESLRRGNDEKADWIQRALWAQIVAILALSIGVSIALFESL